MPEPTTDSPVASPAPAPALLSPSWADVGSIKLLATAFGVGVAAFKDLALPQLVSLTAMIVAFLLCKTKLDLAKVAAGVPVKR